jgi:hypothetical protein
VGVCDRDAAHRSHRFGLGFGLWAGLVDAPSGAAHVVEHRWFAGL